jgi:NitT/TauT family transport system permease protein
MPRVLRWIVSPPVIVFACVLSSAELVVRLGWLPRFLVPAPTEVASALVEFAGQLTQKTLETALASVVGFAMSAALGLVAGVALASGRWVQRAFYPYAIFFQTVPIVAIAPLLAIWFGLDIKAVIASSFIVSLFPVIANTLSGLLSTDAALRDLFKLYGAGPVATLLKLRLPFALPAIMTGLRISAGLAVVGAIVGEFITGGGLGGLIAQARRAQRVDKVFAILLLSALLGIVLFGFVNLLSRLALRNWHQSERRQ